jgi:hypothetical protein
MKLETDWNKAVFIPENDKEEQLLKDLCSCLGKDERATLQKSKLEIETYW